MPLQVGSDEQAIFRGLVIGICVKPGNSCKLAAFLIERDESHLALEIDLREPHEHLVVKVTAGCQKTKSDVCRGRPRQKIRIEARVGWFDWPQLVSAPRDRDLSFPVARIWSDCEVTAGAGTCDCLRVYFDAGIQRNDALGAGNERIDIHRKNAGEIDNHLRERRKRFADRCSVCRRLVAEPGEKPPDPRLGDQVAGEHGVERRQGDGGVRDHFNGDASRSE